MSKRNEHLIVVMLEPVAPGIEFEQWPLHITLVPWFPVSDEAKLDSVLQKLAAKNEPVYVEVGPLAKFGPMKDLPVNLVNHDGDLYRLHWDVFQTLEKNGFPIHQKNHLGQNYRAHITHQSNGGKKEGERLEINKFTLVKQLRQKKTGAMIKSVVREYQLG